jgi:hypothetical protein
MKFHLPTSLAHPPLPRIGDRRKPSRDWLILLTLAFLILIASIGWNVWAFVRITNGEVSGSTTTSTNGPDISIVEQVRGVFVERAAEEQRYRTEYRFVDPSK